MGLPHRGILLAVGAIPVENQQLIIIFTTACTPELAPDRTIRKFCIVDIDVVLLRILNDFSDQSGIYIANAPTRGATCIWQGEWYH
jgi:hypothetical protein